MSDITGSGSGANVGRPCRPGANCIEAAVNFTYVKTRATFGNDGALARTDTRLSDSIGPSRKIGPA